MKAEVEMCDLPNFLSCRNATLLQACLVVHSACSVQSSSFFCRLEAIHNSVLKSCYDSNIVLIEKWNET